MPRAATLIAGLARTFLLCVFRPAVLQAAGSNRSISPSFQLTGYKALRLSLPKHAFSKLHSTFDALFPAFACAGRGDYGDYQRRAGHKTQDCFDLAHFLTRFVPVFRILEVFTVPYTRPMPAAHTGVCVRSAFWQNGGSSGQAKRRQAWGVLPPLKFGQMPNANEILLLTSSQLGQH